MTRTLTTMALALLAALTPAAPASARPRLCTTQQLRVRLAVSSGATGHTSLGFKLRNTGPRCHTKGFPGIGLNGRHGKRVPVHVRRGTRDFFGRTPKRRLVIAHGGVASFRLTGVNGINGGHCPTAYSLDFIAPDRRRSRRVSVGRGFLACPGGVAVSPILAGRRAYA